MFKQMQINKGHIYLSLNMQIQMHPGLYVLIHPEQQLAEWEWK